MPGEVPLLHFAERYYERIWGGHRLRESFRKDAPADKPIGEAWLISDHAGDESVVDEGPLAGQSIRDLLEEDAAAVLGTGAQLTAHGRFPLLLKLLDSADNLSVQVHPDDGCAARLGEPDVGKTEMWHVLSADPGSKLICGLDPAVTGEQFAGAVRDGSIEELMTRFDVAPGTSAFVAAGTVHAIGGGIVLAEIQQNSDLTYRLYDWGRVQADGTARELHVDKALEAIHFGSPHGGAAEPLDYARGSLTRSVLAACRYFAAERVTLEGGATCETQGRSFHIVLGVSGSVGVTAGESQRPVGPGEAVLLPGRFERFDVEGPGVYLDYYVPDLAADVVGPLREAGHPMEVIVRLGDLARVVG